MPSTNLYEYKPVPAAWLRRDVLLFANSIGCDASELHFLYESHPCFQVFPTYPIVLTFKHASTDVIDFSTHFNRFLLPPTIPHLPGLPALDSSRVVDGERSIEIYRPLPVSSERRTFEIRSAILEVWDKGPKGTVVQTEHLLVETGVHEKLYSRSTETAFYMAQGGWGGPNAPRRNTQKPLPESPPTATHIHEVPLNAHLLYRLNGDYNPLHATNCPEAVVQPTPIMHGLYSWNAVCRDILARFCHSDPTALRSFEARFASPVRPGDTLVTDVWLCNTVEGYGPGVWKLLRFATRIRGGDACLTNGLAIVRVENKTNSKL